jgi:hypothetical protein
VRKFGGLFLATTLIKPAFCDLSLAYITDPLALAARIQPAESWAECTFFFSAMRVTLEQELTIHVQAELEC